MKLINAQKIRSNKYDYFLILFISLLSFGDIGGGFQPVRIFIIPFIFPSVFYFLNKRNVYYKYRNIALFFLIWFIYALISLFVSYDTEFSVLRTTYLLWHFLCVFVLFYLFERSNNSVSSLFKGWLFVFLITSILAIIELNTGFHLSISFVDKAFVSDGIMVQERNFASVTFGNLNAYNTLICYIIPFIIANLLSLRGKKLHYKIFIYIVFFLYVYILISNASRGALLVLAISVLYFVLKLFKKKLVYSLLSILLLASIFIVLYQSGYFDIILIRLSTAGFDDSSRFELIYYSFKALLDTNFLGVGIGNYQYVMSEKYNLFITAPHNLFMEIMMEFGLFIFFAFCFFLFGIFKRGLRVKYLKIQNVIVLGLIILPVIGIINSNYLSYPSLWLYIASLYALSKFCVLK